MTKETLNTVRGYAGLILMMACPLPALTLLHKLVPACPAEPWQFWSSLGVGMLGVLLLPIQWWVRLIILGVYGPVTFLFLWFPASCF